MKIENLMDVGAARSSTPEKPATRVGEAVRRSSTMRRALGLCVILLATVAGMNTVHAQILNGGVGFDPQTNLYTYVYIVDNRFGSAPIREVSVLIDSINRFNLAQPSAQTSPDGWLFQKTFSATIEEPPFQLSGAFFGWTPLCCSNLGVLPADVLGGFSFSLPLAPTAGNANNYFLYGDGRVIEFGPIVAPDFFGFQPVPLPAGLWLLASAVTSLAITRRRRAC